jgi:acyl-CoA dehydrogenase
MTGARRVHRARDQAARGQDDNERFFDHRREWARTDWEAAACPTQGVGGAAPPRCAVGPTRPATAASPAQGVRRQGGSNLEMAIIREHLATKGLGLHNDLQNESSIVGNFPSVLMMRDFGTEEQKAEWMPKACSTAPAARLRPHRAQPRLRRHVHGDHRGARRRRVGDQRQKRFNTGMHHATHDIIFARTSARPATPTASPRSSCRPTRPASDRLLLVDVQHADRPRRGVADRRAVPAQTPCSAARAGPRVAQHFVTRTASARPPRRSGAAQYCIDEAVAYANEPQAVRQAPGHQPGHPVPARRAAHRGEMLRQLIRKTAWQMDRGAPHGAHRPGGDVQLPRQPPGLRRRRPAMQTCGGIGYSATCRSSTSTATTAATASPRAPRRSRCASP